MGRTNPTFRDVIEGYKDRWSSYRRALRRRDKNHFDSLIEHVDGHADAAGYMNGEDPVVPILLSMMLEQEKKISELEDELEKLGESDRSGCQ
ncbi:MAG: hypothetical protein ABEK59_01600 [Halobacteria archaeon]